MKNEFYFGSKDGMTQIHAIEWVPEKEVTAVLQICHGMVEYIDRYHDFAQFMASNGVCVIGHDHLGHGKSVTESKKLGYFSEKNGNKCVVGDIHCLREITEKKYPGVPYFIMGHSMGSFLVRQYIGHYSDGLAGAIIMGTGEQPAIILAGGKMICNVIAAAKGWTHRSAFINNMAIGAYEKKMGKAWLTKNTEVVEKYTSDPLCGFMFTVNAYFNMFCGMEKMNQQEKNAMASKTLPLLFVAGQDDPVGNFGKGVEHVFGLYKKQGYQDISIKLYPNDRHEILNETDREVVYGDILKWLENRK